MYLYMCIYEYVNMYNYVLINVNMYFSHMHAS